jgi:hypothetical protein
LKNTPIENKELMRQSPHKKDEKPKTSAEVGLLLLILRANGPHPYQPGAAPRDPRRPPIQGLKARTITFPGHPMPIATMDFFRDAAWKDDDRSGFQPSML